MAVTLAAQPFTDIKVALEKDLDTSDATNTVDNSYGITIDAASKAGVQMGSETETVYLGFSCSATANATSIKYKVSGTDAANFVLDNAKAAVTVEKAVAGDKPAKTVTVAMVADSSEAGATTVEGACPDMGASIIHWMPRDMGMKVGKFADIEAAYQKNEALTIDADTEYLKEQYCYRAVAAKDAKSTCTFDSQSLGKYSAALYCKSIQGWEYASAATNITAKDNGGTPVSLTLTYKKAIDSKKDNAVILNVCGALAENLQVPYKRVQDEFGGFKGSPSPMVTARRLQATSASASAAANTTNATVQTEWKIQLFVQPDPRAATVVPDDTVTKLKDPSALAAINTITSKKYGAPTVAAAKVVEAAVAWKTNPAGTGGADGITIAGSMTATGYVYCAANNGRLL